MRLTKKEIDGVGVYFMQMGTHCGFYFELNGIQRGAYCIVEGDDFERHFQILEDKAKQSIKEYKTL